MMPTPEPIAERSRQRVIAILDGIELGDEFFLKMRKLLRCTAIQNDEAERLNTIRGAIGEKLRRLMRPIRHLPVMLSTSPCHVDGRSDVPLARNLVEDRVNAAAGNGCQGPTTSSSTTCVSAVRPVNTHSGSSSHRTTYPWDGSPRAMNAKK